MELVERDEFLSLLQTRCHWQKAIDPYIASILFKPDVNTRAKAVQEAIRLQIIK